MDLVTPGNILVSLLDIPSSACYNFSFQRCMTDIELQILQFPSLSCYTIWAISCTNQVTRKLKLRGEVRNLLKGSIGKSGQIAQPCHERQVNVQTILCPFCQAKYEYSLRSKMQVVLTFLDSYILLYIQTYVISRCIANTMNLEKPKRPTFWNGGSTVYTDSSNVVCSK